MTRHRLIENIRNKKSILCIGLDTDVQKIPKYLLDYDDPVFEFNKQIIEATHDLCVAVKPNIAFYECLGISGWNSLSKTMKIIPDTIFTIADAKRGDIGNTSAMYAKTFFEIYDFDAVTVAPYMGFDSVEPFLRYENKWTILLALTSNPGSADFQFLDSAGQSLFEHVIRKSIEWKSSGNLMYVIGATKASMLNDIRKIIPDHFLLVPGVGAQGGTVAEVCRYGMNKDFGLLINASRSILYASSGKDFALRAREEALKLVEEMKPFFQT
ncbi:MAG: orotidine-5'-phosphate decarboxylase [Bacteroidia bacterium]|nr:orotidine-5'-phosphate decarboxylase [Bacteroidia bacterium]